MIQVCFATEHFKSHKEPFWNIVFLLINGKSVTCWQESTAYTFHTNIQTLKTYVEKRLNFSENSSDSFLSSCS